jgi:hypothetical protein
MSLINTIKSMQEQGMSNSQIIQNLKEQNYKPQQINNALQQASIKSAISPPQSPQNQQEQTQNPPAPTPSQNSNTQQYTQPVETQNPTQQIPTPAPETTQTNQTTQEEYIPQTPAQDYSYYEYSPQSGNVNDIAEEVVDEKIQEILKSLDKLNRFQTSTKKRITNLNNRLEKIEKTIEDLQQKIIGKIGNYGEAIENIKEDMDMMQDSFSKALSPLIKKGRKSKRGRKKKS